MLLLKKTAPTRSQRAWQAHHQPTSGKAAGKAGSRPGHWSTALAQPQSFTVTVRLSHQSKPRQAKSCCSSRRAANSTGSRRFVAEFLWCFRSLAADGMDLPIQQPSLAMGLRKSTHAHTKILTAFNWAVYVVSIIIIGIVPYGSNSEDVLSPDVSPLPLLPPHHLY